MNVMVMSVVRLSVIRLSVAAPKILALSKQILICLQKSLKLSSCNVHGQKTRRIKPGTDDIKLFTAVIYRHCMVIPSFCVIKQHFLGNYCGMAVNYHGICQCYEA